MTDETLYEMYVRLGREAQAQREARSQAVAEARQAYRVFVEEVTGKSGEFAQLNVQVTDMGGLLHIMRGRLTLRTKLSSEGVYELVKISAQDDLEPVGEYTSIAKLKQEIATLLAGV